jgi:hypothetical protein
LLLLFVCVEKTQYTDANFRAARADLQAGRYEAADKKMSSYIKKNLGAFQYVADLTLAYSPTPLAWATPEADAAHAPAAPAMNAGNVKGPQKTPPRRSLPHVRPGRLMGRLGVVRSLTERLAYLSPRSQPNNQPAQPQAQPPQRAPFGDILLSDGILDIVQGIAHTQILERPAPIGAETDPKGESALRWHHREWFASAQDDVLVGTMTCHSAYTVDGASTREPCLNVALQLSREHHPELTPAVTITATPLTLTTEQRKRWSLHTVGGEASNVKAVQFLMKLGGTEGVQVADTVATGVVLCVGPSAELHIKDAIKSDDTVPVVLCNGAERVYVIVKVESNGKTYTGNDIHRSVEELVSLSAQRVQSALNKGIASLREDHVLDFSGKMNRVGLRIDPLNPVNSGHESQTCTASPLSHRLESFQDGCFTHSNASNGDSAMSPQQHIVADADLVVQLFQYGRYLMLSAGSSAVMNLQGLWADGPGAAWNGDYHLNINLQMAYWAADAVGLPEVMKPLRGLIQELSKKGMGELNRH